jgi:uncharacterized protein
MALKETQAEPSMEEILASIRRIISEEESDAQPAQPALDLSEPAPADDLMVFDEEVAEEPVQAAARPEPPPHYEPPPAPVHAAPAPSFARVVEESPIVSHGAASLTAGALGRLAGTLRIADHEGQTLEGVVRELLRPMLKDWLDQNLPAIVESRVEAELERIARMSR